MYLTAVVACKRYGGKKAYFSLVVGSNISAAPDSGKRFGTLRSMSMGKEGTTTTVPMVETMAKMLSRSIIFCVAMIPFFGS